MAEDLFLQHEPSRPIPEPARIVNLYDLTHDEEFYSCVHLTAGSRPRRCGNRINKPNRQEARCLYLRIRSSLADGASVQDSLSTFAKLTLCNRDHRPRDGTDALYTSMVQKWSNDLENKKVVLGCPSVEKVVTEAVMFEAEPLLHNPLVSSKRKDPQKSSTIPHGPDSAPSEIIHSEERALKPATSEDEFLLDRPAMLVREKDIHTETTGLSLCGPRQPCSRYGAIPISPPQPLPKRVTRSGTFSQPDEEYLPYCPYLLRLTPSQLIHHTNNSLLSLLARPLKTMAKKDGCVYIFTRPDDPSLVKVGFTKHSGKARVAAWGESCCYAARLEFATEMMPHAWLVERLVQEQLKQYRRKERRCKWKATCSTQHKEWYEISVREARRVVETWAGWITKYRPWGADDVLTPDWARLLNRYRIALKGPDRDVELWDRWVRMEEPRIAVPFVGSPSLKPEPEPEQHNPNTGILNPKADRKSSSSTAVQNTEPKIVRKPRLPNLHTETPKSNQSDSSSPPSSSPSPSQISLPATPLRCSIRRSFHQTPSTTVRAVLKSALSNIDAYIGASSGKNKKAAQRQVTIRMDRRSMSLAWGELDEGYFTA